MSASIDLLNKKMFPGIDVIELFWKDFWKI